MYCKYLAEIFMLSEYVYVLQYLWHLLICVTVCWSKVFVYVAILHTLCVQICFIVYLIYDSFFTSYKKD